MTTISRTTENRQDTALNSAAFLSILAEDKFSVSYRPRFAALTDSALAAILLQQIIHWWKAKDSKPFYKFRAPCQHTKYQEGQSWCEELAWNKYEFDNALKVIGTKITKGISKQTVLETDMPERLENETDEDFAARLSAAVKSIVIYWTDSSRVTWYQVNTDLLGKFVGRIYLDKFYGLRYLVKPKVKFTQKNPKVEFTSPTEITKDKHKEVARSRAIPRTAKPLPYPDRIRDWTQKHVDQYYTGHISTLDSLASIWSQGTYQHLLEMPLYDSRAMIEQYQEILRQPAITAADYPALIKATKKANSWKKGGADIADISKQITPFLQNRPKPKKVIELDPALDLSIQHPVTPMMIARRKAAANE